MVAPGAGARHVLEVIAVTVCTVARWDHLQDESSWHCGDAVQDLLHSGVLSLHRQRLVRLSRVDVVMPVDVRFSVLKPALPREAEHGHLGVLVAHAHLDVQVVLDRVATKDMRSSSVYGTPATLPLHAWALFESRATTLGRLACGRACVGWLVHPVTCTA